jgi:hypothetical protein
MDVLQELFGFMVLCEFAFGALVLAAVRRISGRWSLIVIGLVGYQFFLVPALWLAGLWGSI